jgi:carbon storage regulator
MLVLTRRVGEEIVIAGSIRITVLSVRGEQVRLGITAPPSVCVDREEIHARRAEFADAPTRSKGKQTEKHLALVVV